MKCRNCGKEIDDGVEFCYFCGESFEDDVDNEKVESANEEMFVKCPECGNRMRKGKVEVIDIEHLLIPRVMTSWYPDEDKDKIFRKNIVHLKLEAEGYYCDKCEKVVAIFERD